MVLLKCDSCGLAREIPDKFANKTVNCPKCKKRVSIEGDIDWDIKMIKKVRALSSFNPAKRPIFKSPSEPLDAPRRQVRLPESV